MYDVRLRTKKKKRKFEKIRLFLLFYKDMWYNYYVIHKYVKNTRKSPSNFGLFLFYRQVFLRKNADICAKYLQRSEKSVIIISGDINGKNELISR